jgi:hypothetical protein
MAKKNETTSVNDTTILKLKKQIEEKKKLLSGASRFSPITNCMLTFNGERHNLNVIDKDTILLLIAQLNSLHKSLYEVLPEETLKVSNFTVIEWITDLKNKYTILNKKLEEDRLKKLEARLHGLLSTDKKVELEINELMNEI